MGKFNFMSGGYYPIYDKYAFVALNAIHDGISPADSLYDPLKYTEPPAKSIKDFGKRVFEEKYQGYIDKLNKIFGDEYKKKRDIDRALWAYGHEFRIM